MRKSSGHIQWDDWECSTWVPPDDLTVDQWAERNVILPRSVTAEPGPVSLDRTPYLREILRAMTDPDVEEITLCFSTQVGKTTACMLPVLYYLDQDPWPCLHVMPREEDAVAVNVDRYQKIIEASPNLSRHLTGAANDMTREAIRLNGTALTFVGANSPAALSSRSICVLVLDETDKYPHFSGQEADPISLARERTRTFGNRKIIKVSTPTTERGYIWREYLQSDRRRYLVPCLHCGRRQPLVIGNGSEGSPGIHLPPGERDPEKIVDLRLAWYECEACHRRIDDVAKPLMLRRGVWCPQNCDVSDDGVVFGPIPPRRLSGYHLSALYSPWLTWSAIVAEFLRSKAFQGKLMNFRNSWEAAVWEDTIDEVKASHVRARVGGYEIGTVPAAAHCLTAGVDVQLDHLWYVIRAWGAHGESWLVREGRLEGWEALNNVLFRAQYMAGADPVPMKCVLIDMGYRTDEVFAFARQTGCQPVKGAASPSRSFTVSKHQHADGTMTPLVLIDTGYYKAKLHRLIRIRDEDPGSWHLPGVVAENGITIGGVDDEYYAHIVSEQRVREQEKKTGRVHYPWKRIPPGAANHLLDCEVYALAAAEILDVEHVYTAQPTRSEGGSVAVPVNQGSTTGNQAPNRRRFQQIKSRFFS